MKNLEELKKELKVLEHEKSELEADLDGLRADIADLEDEIEKVRRYVVLGPGDGIIFRGMQGIVISIIDELIAIEAVIKEPRGYFEERILMNSSELSIMNAEASEALYEMFRKDGKI